MNKNELLDEILAIIRMVKDDKVSLQKIHTFLMDEVYEEPDEADEIPEKYRKVVSEIAGSLQAGFHCYLNPETLEVEDIPELLLTDPSEYEMLTGETESETGFKYKKWESSIYVEPMPTSGSFKVMEYFVDEIENPAFQKKLVYALDHRKPFANFKFLVENSPYREQWFNFQKNQWEQYVWREIEYELEKFNQL